MTDAIDAIDRMIGEGLDLVGRALQAGLTQDSPRVQRLITNIRLLRELRDTLVRQARMAAAAHTN